MHALSPRTVWHQHTYDIWKTIRPLLLLLLGFQWCSQSSTFPSILEWWSCWGQQQAEGQMAGGIGMNEHVHVHVLSSDSSFLSQSFFSKAVRYKIMGSPDSHALSLFADFNSFQIHWHHSIAVMNNFKILMFAAMYNKLSPSISKWVAISQLDY